MWTLKESKGEIHLCLGNLIRSMKTQEIATQLPRLFYNVREAAQIMGVSEKSIYRLLNRGLLKSSAALRTKMITAESIQAFVSLTVNGGVE